MHFFPTLTFHLHYQETTPLMLHTNNLQAVWVGLEQIVIIQQSRSHSLE